MANSDLVVEEISAALAGKEIDVVITGSIGAVESPRFLRSLRRLGAKVFPSLSHGAQNFTTKVAVEWAADQVATVEFSGLASHIASRDACLVTPASANIISKIANGITDTPESALIASYLGSGKPVIVLPNMHDSLMNSPIVAENLAKIKKYCFVIKGREEEGKQKFPEPKVLADEVAHILNRRSDNPVMIAMGTTRGYIDDVRYISNYSSGALGSKISEELYRNGFTTLVVAGPCPIRPQVYSEIYDIETNEDLLETSLRLVSERDCSVVFAASVLDYIPTTRHDGKLKSSQELKVEFQKTIKILETLKPKTGLKIGFKLESSLDKAKAETIANDYMDRYNLNLMVLNGLNAVDQQRHAAYIFKKHDCSTSQLFLESKQSIARELTQYLMNSTRPSR